MRAVLLLPALLASCRASVYPSPYPSLCDEVEACVLEVGRVCAHKHLQTTVLKFMTLEYFDCIDHTAFDAEGCFVEDDSKRDACLTVASPSEDGPQEDHALWLDFQKVEGYLECVDDLAEERYQAATTGDACWTQCPPLCGDSLSFDDEEAERFNDCKSMCQLKLGCHALNEEYRYDPINDVARLGPSMTSGCRATLKNGDPLQARLWKGTTERMRLQKALQNPRSVASTRLKYLLEDASENGGRDPPDRDTLQAAERRLLAEKEVLDEVLRRARGEDPSGEDPFYEDPRSGELR